MGSPDPYGRQLNGMGSGISSTSKICVIEKSQRPDFDIDYTFVQVGIKDGSLEFTGNCGNMSSAVGPVALDLGMVSPSQHDRESMTVRIFNTNTSKEIQSTFRIDEQSRNYQPSGDYSIDGVPGNASQIILSFLRPGGAGTGKTFPTGRTIDQLRLPSGETIEATLSDIANPGVFVSASDLGLQAIVTPEQLGADSSLMGRLEAIRRAGTSMMGLDPNIQSVPKVVILASPSAEQAADGTNIVCRALSMQQPHKAVPLTLALNLGASVFLPGTLAAKLAVNMDKPGSVTIAHASGKLDVGSVVKDGVIESAQLHRTARILMRGDVFYTLLSDSL